MFRLFCLLTLVLVSGCASSRFVAPTPEAAAYRAALLDLREADQRLRHRYVALLKRYDYQPPEERRLKLARTIHHTDSLNLLALDALVTANGWPRMAEVGWHGASAAYLVVQHAELADQIRYRPQLEAAVETGDASPAWLAELTDRIAVRQGEPQPYGSQIQTDAETGVRRFHPILNPDAIDARRAEVGLEPLAAYAQRMDVMWAP